MCSHCSPPTQLSKTGRQDQTYAPRMLPVFSGAVVVSAKPTVLGHTWACPALWVGLLWWPWADALEKGHCIPECFPKTAAQGISSTATPFCYLSPVKLCFPDVCAIFPLTLVDFKHSQPLPARSLPWILYCPRGISSSSSCFSMAIKTFTWWFWVLCWKTVSSCSLSGFPQWLTCSSLPSPAKLFLFYVLTSLNKKAERQNMPVFQISSCSEGTQIERLEAESGAGYFGILCCLAQRSHNSSQVILGPLLARDAPCTKELLCSISYGHEMSLCLQPGEQEPQRITSCAEASGASGWHHPWWTPPSAALNSIGEQSHLCRQRWYLVSGLQV